MSPGDMENRPDVRCICSVCGRSYQDQKSLNRHTSNHKEPAFHCEYCTATFYRRDVRDRHSQEQHKSVQGDPTSKRRRKASSRVDRGNQQASSNSGTNLTGSPASMEVQALARIANHIASDWTTKRCLNATVKLYLTATTDSIISAPKEGPAVIVRPWKAREPANLEAAATLFGGTYELLRIVLCQDLTFAESVDLCVAIRFLAYTEAALGKGAHFARLHLGAVDKLPMYQREDFQRAAKSLTELIARQFNFFSLAKSPLSLTAELDNNNRWLDIDDRVVVQDREFYCSRSLAPSWNWGCPSPTVLQVQRELLGLGPKAVSNFISGPSNIDFAAWRRHQRS